MQIPREFLAPGVQAYDHTLVGDDYLKQFGPEVQGAVQAYMRGGVMPTGNPRNQGIAKLLGSLPRPQTTAEAMKLPKGTHFVDPTGIERVR
jgi:hypothetical protein